MAQFGGPVQTEAAASPKGENGASVAAETPFLAVNLPEPDPMQSDAVLAAQLLVEASQVGRLAQAHCHDSNVGAIGLNMPCALPCVAVDAGVYNQQLQHMMAGATNLTHPPQPDNAILASSQVMATAVDPLLSKRRRNCHYCGYSRNSQGSLLDCPQCDNVYHRDCFGPSIGACTKCMQLCCCGTTLGKDCDTAERLANPEEFRHKNKRAYVCIGKCCKVCLIRAHVRAAILMLTSIAASPESLSYL
jgi:hypothetical protein